MQHGSWEHLSILIYYEQRNELFKGWSEDKFETSTMKRSNKNAPRPITPRIVQARPRHRNIGRNWFLVIHPTVCNIQLAAVPEKYGTSNIQSPGQIFWPFLQAWLFSWHKIPLLVLSSKSKWGNRGKRPRTPEWSPGAEKDTEIKFFYGNNQSSIQGKKEE